MRPKSAVVVWLALVVAASATDEPWQRIPAVATSVVRVAPADDWREACNDFTAGVRATIVGLNRGGLNAFDSIAATDWLYQSYVPGTHITADRAGYHLTEFVSPKAPTYYVSLPPAEGASAGGMVMYFKSVGDDVFAAIAKAGGPMAPGAREKLDGGWERIAFAKQKLLVAQRGEWSVIATSEAARAALIAGEARRETLATLDAETRRLLTAGHVSWWHNLELGDDRTDWEAQHRWLRNAIASLPDRAFGSPGAAEATRGLYSAIADAGLQTIKETRWVSLNASFTNTGVEFESLFRLVNGAAVERWLPPGAASSMELLDELPAGAPLYASASFDVQAFEAAQVAAYTPADEGLRRRMEAFWKSLQKCGLGEVASAIWMPAPVTGFEAVNYQRAKRPAELLAAVRTLLRDEAKLESGAGAVTTTMQLEAETHNGRPIDRITVTNPIMAPDEAFLGSFLSQYLKGLKLGDQYQVRLAAHDDRLLQAVGPTPAMIEKAIDTVDSKHPTLGQGRAYGATRERLLTDAHFVGLMDLPAVARELMYGPAQTEPAPNKARAVGREPLPPTYWGVSLTVEPAGVRIKGFVPVEQIAGLFAMLMR